MTIEVAHKLKAKVVAGTGSNNTAATIEFTRKVARTRRGRRIGRRAVLQQTDAGRNVRAFRGNRQIGQEISDHALQRAVAHRVKYFRRNDFKTCRKIRKHRGDQRSVGQFFADYGNLRKTSEKFQSFFRRRRDDSAFNFRRRGRFGFGLLERNSEGNFRRWSKKRCRARGLPRGKFITKFCL